MSGAGGFEAHDEHDGYEGRGAREGSGDRGVFPESTEKLSDGLGKGDDSPHGPGDDHEGGRGADEHGTGDPARAGTDEYGKADPNTPGTDTHANTDPNTPATHTHPNTDPHNPATHTHPNTDPNNPATGGTGDPSPLDPGRPGNPGPGGTDGEGDPTRPGAGGAGSAGDGGPDNPDDPAGNTSHGTGPQHPPRIPLPRASVEDTGRPLPVLEEPAPSAPLVLEHRVLKALLGAWALAACSAEETAAVEDHLGVCGACADEALRLRGAVGLLQRPESLDLDPGLRTRVLDSCLDRRPPRIPMPEWATPYDAETARLDALLQDFGDAEWHAPVRLRWFDADEATSRRTTVAGVIAHLMSVDGLVAVALGLDDPMGEVPADAPTPAGRTEAYWRASHFPPTRSVRTPWREQSHDLVRTVSFTGGTSGKLEVDYGDFVLPLHDAMLDRAFECWVHAEDIAEAVDYPYEPPSPRHLNRMIDLAARVLPAVLAERRQKGLASPIHGRHLVSAGGPGRTLRLEIEGLGGGEWLIPLDSPAEVGSAEHEVAHVALDGVEFCQLAAGHVPPAEAAAGQLGDREAIRDVLFAAASLSRM